MRICMFSYNKKDNIYFYTKKCCETNLDQKAKQLNERIKKSQRGSRHSKLKLPHCFLSLMTTLLPFSCLNASCSLVYPFIFTCMWLILACFHFLFDKLEYLYILFIFVLCWFFCNHLIVGLKWTFSCEVMCKT